HSVDSVASYSSQNHVDRIRTQNFSAASCQDEGDFGSIKTSLFRRSSSNLEYPHKRPESVTSNASSTRSRLRELVERKSSQDEHKSAANTVGDIQYFENPTETLEFDKPRNSLESKKSQEERPKKRKHSKVKEKDKDICENKNKKHEKYQSKLAEYYKLPVQLPQDEFYQHLTRSKAAEELLQKRFSNSDTEFSGSYGRLCKHKEPEPSNLRRSRSLAVIREETFTDLQIQNHAKSKRSQLIPRARLFDKPCFKDRFPGRAKYQTKEEVLESIYIDSTASCFGDINAQRESDIQIATPDNKSEKEDALSRNESHHSRSVSGSWPNLNEESKQTNLSEDSIGHSRNPSEIDSLDSNYVRKHYNFEAHRKNYKDSSPETERSAVSPNHSKELYVTTDDHDTDNEDRGRSKNNTPKSFTNDSLSITHSDKDKGELIPPVNINETHSCDEIPITNNQEETQDNKDPDTISKKSEPKPDEDAQSIVSESDGTISSPHDSITSYISISIASSDKSHKLEYLANSLAEKIDEYCDSQFKENISVTSRTINSENNPESDPIYTKVNKKKTFADIKRDSFSSKSVNLFNEIHKNQNNEVYISNTYIESDTFSTKSNCTSTKNITTEPFVTTLIENQYYSLPDINISKCLRKSERIDAQLREEDPEDIPCENTYEIAQTHFREILSSKGNGNYGQLNKSNINHNNNTLKTNNPIYLPEYSEPHLIQNFTKLEDDLKSIITIESSNADDKEIFYSSDTHQNEREINEIEGTIRNNKVITKSESLKINSVYRPEINIIKSLSNDNICKTVQEKKSRVGIKKHYSLRQRDPVDEDINRIPSPNTVERSLYKSTDSPLVKSSQIEEIKAQSLLSRVQSFKTSAESNIAIVPLSGHQTIVIDPPLNQKPSDINLPTVSQQKEVISNKDNKDTEVKVEPIKPIKKEQETQSEKNKEIKKPTTENSSIDTSSFHTPKDPFITIKLNKVVKTTIPKLKKETSEKISYVQHRFEKPPPKLIIKDKNCNDTQVYSFKKVNTTMTRPQVLQVIDSRSKQNTANKMEKNTVYTPINTAEVAKTEEKINVKVDSVPEVKEELKTESSVKEKLHNAIKTDIEYQEKLNSVKNYWSRLIDKGPDVKEQKSENDYKHEELFNNNNQQQINDMADELKEQNVNDNEEEKSSPEISVGNIIKSLESVKIVDSIRKISQTKLHLWKDETEKVKSDSEIEETPLEKIVKDTETQVYEKPKPKKPETEFSRDTPEIEIVELTSEDNQNMKTQATLIKAKGFEKGCDEFDHVRYKVMKSELFKNSMIANYRKEAQFDGLLQYLQDYSFQELLVNNNIVIIEPVRTKVEPVPRKNTDTCKIPPTLLKKNENPCSQVDKSKNAIRRHFFYHPIRVNKEIIEEELPNPDTVKKVRNLFEDTLKMKSPMTQDPPLIDENMGLTRRATSYRNLSEETKGSRMGGRKKVIRQLTIDTNFGNKKWDNASLSSGVSSGDLSSNNEFENEALSPYSHKNLKDNSYSSSDEYLCDSMSQDFCCESQYVSPDILKKIRECGTSVTYYGGKVLNSKTGSTVSPMTKAIMEEIKSLQKNCSRDCYSCQTKCRGNRCSCLVADKHKQMVSEKQKVSSTTEPINQAQNKFTRAEGFPGFKFKLVKSNSCSSRLELTGTDDSKNPRVKYRKFQTDDPPLVYDDENSVKNKICRLESYNKGIVKTPFDNNKSDDKKENQKSKHNIKRIESELRRSESTSQTNIAVPTIKEDDSKENSETAEGRKNLTQAEKEKQALEAHSFEKKFYYVNDNVDQTKTTTGKFGEMVFEEFEVLESCFDSLNSNKSLK
ncbi:protein javelin, partial [Ostrinia furnacalis]|uniref:protein javelin n=1 Tax=Ostrinia furnacalis TaxID=93504 RepID=UPI00103C3B12